MMASSKPMTLATCNTAALNSMCSLESSVSRHVYAVSSQHVCEKALHAASQRRLYISARMLSGDVLGEMDKSNTSSPNDLRVAGDCSSEADVSVYHVDVQGWFGCQ